jgi:hypothetical protein
VTNGTISGSLSLIQRQPFTHKTSNTISLLYWQPITADKQIFQVTSVSYKSIESPIQSPIDRLSIKGTCFTHVFLQPIWF